MRLRDALIFMAFSFGGTIVDVLFHHFTHGRPNAFCNTQTLVVAAMITILMAIRERREA